MKNKIKTFALFFIIVFLMNTSVSSADYKKENKMYSEIGHKLYKNMYKTMDSHDDTLPPNIPPSVTKYANKYMMKGIGRKIVYTTDWNGNHVYRVYWKKYGNMTHPLATIIYDGKTIRRPYYKDYIWIELKEKNWI